MKKLLIVFLVISVLFHVDSLGQLSGKLNVGVGAGLDYGGFGAQISYLPLDRFDLFGGFGYNLNSLGYNFGVKLRFPTERRINWHLNAMYGYNAVLIVKGMTSDKTTYYGPSVGAGMIFKSRSPKKSFFSFEIILPVRPEAFHDVIYDLKLIGYDVREPLPVAFSFGYHFLFF
jgi:hypothetical protein